MCCQKIGKEKLACMLFFVLSCWIFSLCVCVFLRATLINVFGHRVFVCDWKQNKLGFLDSVSSLLAFFLVFNREKNRVASFAES